MLFSWLDSSVIFKEFVESTQKLAFSVGFLLEGFSTELELHIKGCISDGYGDFRCDFDFHMFCLIILDIYAILFDLHFE
jgi:hypothetical protein